MTPYQIVMVCVTIMSVGVVVLSSRIGRSKPKDGDVTPHGPKSFTCSLPPGF